MNQKLTTEKIENIDKIFEKHELSHSSDLLFDLEDWQKIFSKVKLNDGKIKELLDERADDVVKQYGWYKLYNVYSSKLEDEEFASIYNEEIKKLEDKTYTKPNEIYSICSVLLELSFDKFCNISKEKIVRLAKDSIDEHCQKWDNFDFKYPTVLVLKGYNIDAKYNDEQNEIRQYIINKGIESFEIRTKDLIDKALTSLQKDRNISDLEKLFVQDKRILDYSLEALHNSFGVKMPFFAFVDIDRLVEILYKIDNKTIKEFYFIIIKNYGLKQIYNYDLLQKDLEAMKQFKAKIEKKINTNKPVKQYFISQIINRYSTKGDEPCINRYIKDFENYLAEKSSND